MIIERAYELPGRTVVELGWDGERMLWHWEGPDPRSMSPDLKRKVEVAYLYARSVFLRDVAILIEAAGEDDATEEPDEAA